MQIATRSSISQRGGARPSVGRRAGTSGFVAPTLFLLILTTGYPLAYSIYISLQSWNQLTGLHRPVGLANYGGLLADPEFRHELLLTCEYTGASVVIQFVLGLGLALLIRTGLQRRLRGFESARVILLLPIAIAPIVWGFYFSQLLDPNVGTFNKVLTLLHLPTSTWTNGVHTALWSLVLSDSWQWIAIMFTLLLGGFLGLSSEVIEAATVDGAGWIRRLFLIELPLLKPVILLAVLLRIIDSIKNIDLVYVLTGGGPGTSTNILNFASYKTGFQEYELGMASAIAIVVFVIIMLVTVMTMVAFKEEMT